MFSQLTVYNHILVIVTSYVKWVYKQHTALEEVKLKDRPWLMYLHNYKELLHIKNSSMFNS